MYFITAMTFSLKFLLFFCNFVCVLTQPPVCKTFHIHCFKAKW